MPWRIALEPESWFILAAVLAVQYWYVTVALAAGIGLLIWHRLRPTQDSETQ